jgi:hypothetical protein
MEPAVHYDIRVNGHLDGPWSAWFDGLQVSCDDRAETTITGPVADQAALRGLPAKVRDWALSCSRCAAPTPADHRHGGMAMQPSKHPSASRAGIAWLPTRILALVVVAGSASLFATFWDDAWHTDLGRDQATIPPHLLLYGSVAVVGGVVVAWGLSALRRSRSLVAVLRQPPLLLAATGGTVTLAAMPIDAAWHAAFGRDAVLWSPPHMLGVFGSLALLVGILAGARSESETHPWILAGLGALLLGSAIIPVLEFETDVPQFSEALYLPVLLAASLFAAVVLRHVIPGPLPVARAVGIYVLLRVAIMIGLDGLDRSVPDLPLAILGLAAVDLPWRTAAARYSGGAAAVALTALVASAAGLARVPAGAVAIVAVPVVLVSVVVLAIQAGRLRRSRRPSVLLLLALVLALSPTAAGAHDPGQGRTIAPVTLTGTSDGHGSLTITAETPADACSALTPGRVIARRAGQTVTGALAATGPCRSAGQVRVTAAGRWFLYAQPRLGARVLEAWLPMDAARAGRVVERRELYLPVGRPDGAGLPTAEVVSGIILYALGAFLLALILLQVRGLARTSPARSSSLGSSPIR